MKAVLSIGSNKGDKLAQLCAVKDFFGDAVTSFSSVWVTAPWGGVKQDDFLNAVLILVTPLSPVELLRQGQQLERAAGRTRDIRWGPRTLDVDLVACFDDTTGEELILDTPTLSLPHPRAHERAFVLQPWDEADPGAVLSQRPVSQWLKELPPGETKGVRRAGADAQWSVLK